MPSGMKWAISLLVGFGIIVIGFRWAGWLLTSFFVLNCLVLIIVVLLQSGKAADPRRCLRRSGQPDCFRSPWRGIGSFASYHLVRHHVHGLRHGSRGPR